MVAVPGILLFLWVILFGEPVWLLLLFSVLGFLAGAEAVSLCVSAQPPFYIRLGAGLASGLSVWLVGTGSPLQAPALLLPGGCFALWWLFTRGPEGARAGILGVMALTLFYSVGFGALARLGVFWPGKTYALLPLVSCWAGDSLAYFAGCRWGRHKMLPRISPGKSWEGFAAGIAGSVTGVVAVAPGNLTVVHLVVTGVLCGLAGVAGDFFESAVKRDAGVKDSGGLLGAHGGVLDRFDSVAAAAPVALVILHLLGPAVS